jgi:hypothetical protein
VDNPGILEHFDHLRYLSVILFSKMNDKVEGFACGVAITLLGLLVYRHISKTSKVLPCKKESHPTSTEKLSDDECNSLYYGCFPEGNGVGFPYLGTVDDRTIAKMQAIHPEYTRLPFDLYKKVVENLPIVCVDVICRRQDGKLLLFYRRDKPAAQIWWWPGGRMFRGETFYSAAVRKVVDETGNQSTVVQPKGVVKVWNTFFPDSHWDSERSPDRVGTQTVNIVVVCDIAWLGSPQEAAAGGGVGAGGESARGRTSSGENDWAVEAHKWVSPEELLAPGAYDKYITSNVKAAMNMGLL